MSGGLSPDTIVFFEDRLAPLSEARVGQSSHRSHKNSTLPAISSGDSRSWINTRKRSNSPIGTAPWRQ